MLCPLATKLRGAMLCPLATKLRSAMLFVCVEALRPSQQLFSRDGANASWD